MKISLTSDTRITPGVQPEEKGLFTRSGTVHLLIFRRDFNLATMGEFI
jgi:hypothetical protein